MLIETAQTESPARMGRQLRRSDDGSVFAYARGPDLFFRQSDHALWARLSDGWLVSARSGDRLAYQVGRVFFDAGTDEALYYESP